MKGNLLLRYLAIWLVTIINMALNATTIIPYPNLGSLTARSDALVLARVVKNYEKSQNGQTTFRSRLIVEEFIKGDLQIGEQFEVQKWEKLIDDKWMTMWGDLNLFENARYLLFLEKKEEELYHPICFSYYVFEEISMDGETYIVPSEHAAEFEILDLKEAEPLFVYNKTALFEELQAVTNFSKSWQNGLAKTSLKISDFFGYSQKRAAPTGCTYLYAGSRKIRWNVFPDQNVGIHYNANGAMGCTNSSINDVQQAIVDLQNAYPGINVVDAGTVPNMAQCAIDQSALGADYRQYIDNNFGNFRHVIVQYDDPCNEIADLSNCAGILAIGGAYGIGSHSFDGEDWATGKYGYVVLNNGFGACKCSASASMNTALRQTLSHELSHALGLGHISASNGSANMNPSCCNAISAMDQTCFNYTYPTEAQGSILPLELVNFTGVSQSYKNELRWQTAWESGVGQFQIERSNDNEYDFDPVGLVLAKGDSQTGHEYLWFDMNPATKNFYRLRTIDLDGTYSYSSIIQLDGKRIDHALIYPTITDDLLQIILPDQDLATVQIQAIQGEVISQLTISDYAQISVKELPSGWYYIQISNDFYSDTYRFFRSD